MRLLRRITHGELSYHNLMEIGIITGADKMSVFRPKFEELCHTSWETQRFVADSMCFEILCVLQKFI